MAVDQWLSEIKPLIAARFECCDLTEQTQYLRSLAARSFGEDGRTAGNLDGVSAEEENGGADFEDRTAYQETGLEEAAAQVLTVCRAGMKRAGFRTVLLAQVETLQEAAAALLWCANVRDVLAEPATADLYLFLKIKDATLEDCLRLEADDQYCRKHVERPGESSEDFINRTFLGASITPERGGALVDPVLASLADAANTHDWFSGPEQERWRQALLSGVTGSDLAERIIDGAMRGADDRS